MIFSMQPDNRVEMLYLQNSLGLNDLPTSSALDYMCEFEPPANLNIKSLE